MVDNENENNNNNQIPLIDLAIRDEKIISQQLLDACLNYGFFYLKGHEISEDLIEKVFEQSKQFFSQTTEFKQALSSKNNKYNRGWDGFNQEKLDPAKQKIGDTKEGFYISREVDENSELANLPLHGPNVWPEGWTEWRSVMEQYRDKCEQLGLQMIKYFSLALNQDKFYMDQYFQNPMIFLRLLHYNSTVSNPQEGVFGAGAHTDYGLFTFLKTDEVRGLQIFLNNNWIDVSPIKDCFIVNLGDMVKRISNDRFKSTLHRVINKSGKERYSLPFFFEPSFNALLKPLCAENEQSQYTDNITAGQHLLQKYKETYEYFNQQQQTNQPEKQILQ